jgi:hypothetical protein
MHTGVRAQSGNRNAPRPAQNTLDVATCLREGWMAEHSGSRSRRGAAAAGISLIRQNHPMTTLIDVSLLPSTHQVPSLPRGEAAPPGARRSIAICCPSLDLILKKDGLAMSSFGESQPMTEKIVLPNLPCTSLPVDLGLPLPITRSVSTDSGRSVSSHETRLRHLAMGQQEFAAVLRLLTAREGIMDGSGTDPPSSNVSTE